MQYFEPLQMISQVEDCYEREFVRKAAGALSSICSLN